jgi:hypothetical protein
MVGATGKSLGTAGGGGLSSTQRRLVGTRQCTVASQTSAAGCGGSWLNSVMSVRLAVVAASLCWPRYESCGLHVGLLGMAVLVDGALGVDVVVPGGAGGYPRGGLHAASWRWRLYMPKLGPNGPAGPGVS